MKLVLSLLLLTGLTVLIAARPWHGINQRLGIHTAMDSLRATSAVAGAVTDSLIIDQVAVTLPPIVTDSLSYAVDARQKKKAYLEEQSALLEVENERLEANIKAKRKRVQENILTLKDLNRLLAKQNERPKTANNLGVSPLEEELNKRQGSTDQRHYKNP